MDVHVAQYGIQHISQGDLVIARLPVVADDGLPLYQRFKAAPELPGSHVGEAQQPARGHLLFRRFLQQAQDLPFLIQLAPLRQLLQKRPGVLVIILAEVPGLFGGAGVLFVVQEPGLEWALPADCGSPG